MKMSKALGALAVARRSSPLVPGRCRAAPRTCTGEDHGRPAEPVRAQRIPAARRHRREDIREGRPRGEGPGGGRLLPGAAGDVGRPGADRAARAGAVLAARARGEDVVFIYNLNFAKSVFGLVVQERSPIKTAGRPQGQRSSASAPPTARRSASPARSCRPGMTEGKDYTFLPVGDGGTAAAAFLRGDIEAYAAAISDAAIMETRGIESARDHARRSI